MKPVVTISSRGTKRWKLNGKCHRVDGPAIEWTNGTKQWCINDKLHREDGPAIEYEYRGGRWFIYGKEIDLEEIIKNHPDGYGPWSASDLAKLKLKYL